MSDEFDILYDIDMQLYNEFNDKLCEINEHLGDIYSYKDKADVEDAEKSKERQLLREAVKKLQKELEQEKEKNKEYEESITEGVNGERIYPNHISKDKIRAKIKELKNDCKKCRYKGEICKDLNNHNCCVQGLALKSLKELLVE